jgi:hypothetical protein
MKPTLWAALGALLAVPGCALAQQPRHTAEPADPADPRIAVPAVAYASVFALPSQLRPQERAVTPDKAWKEANATVAASPAHAGHAGHAGHAAPAAAATAAAEPDTQPAVDHSKHH